MGPFDATHTDRNEYNPAMFNDPRAKIRSVDDLLLPLSEARAAGKIIVFGNGCFDLIHVGHVRYLAAAKALGDILVVGINSDASVRGLKGAGRPLQPQEERAEIVASLEAVDYVALFDAPSVEGLLLALKPDIHAKGTDYTRDSVPERETVRSYGGDVAIVGDPKDHSSRDLIGTILAKISQ
jgi:D-glycero-beta-D-manno-heptose 1-phosphate adenylyltransferase